MNMTYSESSIQLGPTKYIGRRSELPFERVRILILDKSHTWEPLGLFNRAYPVQSRDTNVDHGKPRPRTSDINGDRNLLILVRLLLIVRKSREWIFAGNGNVIAMSTLRSNSSCCPYANSGNKLETLWNAFM
ncbi:hypothetical protein WN51_14220 [Melipona quadrifasciata]|uniref:Uncharacterized protein n=1 Tax=Melipona quadrifasciata TaxID=166423 RepID=A0A0M8ZZ92_9HYME|nr:hypothetical protein WN51_14220 [Melipona quadrifasciata]